MIFGKSVALLGLTIGVSVTGAPITGTGYIDVVGDSLAPVPVALSTPQTRFVWAPDIDLLFIGSAGLNYLPFNQSISIMGLGDGLQSISLGGYSDSASVSVGFSSDANLSSIALGAGASADDYSIAIGSRVYDEEFNSYSDTTATGPNSVSIGTIAHSANAGATALGYNAYAGGSNSSALGGNSMAIGGATTAIGYASYALGISSVAIGYSTSSVGNFSSAVGFDLSATAYGAVALGYRNKSTVQKNGTPINPAMRSQLDPILTVGNGVSEANRSNALTVYRDGDAHFQGVVRAKKAGDLEMGIFTEGPLPNL